MSGRKVKWRCISTPVGKNAVQKKKIVAEDPPSLKQLHECGTSQLQFEGRMRKWSAHA